MRPSLVFAVGVLAAVAACTRSEPSKPAPAETTAPAPKPVVPPAVGVYVTNESSGDLSILDAETRAVVSRYRSANVPAESPSARTAPLSTWP